MEEAGLTPSEINIFLCNCYHIVYAAPDEFARGRGQVYSAGRAYSMEGSANASTRSDGSSFTSTSKASRYESLRKDWLRFIAFCRLCIAQLIDRS